MNGITNATRNPLRNESVDAVSINGYKVKIVSQSEYDALTTKDPDTIYFVPETAL